MRLQKLLDSSGDCIETLLQLRAAFCIVWCQSLQALEYKQRIKDAVPHGSNFQPLMTCYLTDATSADDVYEAKNNGIVAYKLYPAGATTNSSSGVTNFQAVIPTLRAMADVS